MVHLTGEIRVEICAGNACRDRAGLALLSQLERLYADRTDVRVLDTGCHYYCEDGPVAVVDGTLILRATIATVSEAVRTAAATEGR